ncbi:hypothetical protein SAMN04490244_101265 [Tranquillimonas rosea]|uniref:Uncharacterized protein n=1 Tax=Tranquillimonas rosea TaxID=641238 RepID=A0A1H9PNJ4_9RHOB|nr:hypothetical protein [Tranquillimonas rosea]SER49717.1 hypothetical protein SAMN04490244_101265 [Tranquillimonas rosea]
MRLNLNRDPEWVDLLPGVSVLAAPATSSVMAQARRDDLLAPYREAGGASDDDEEAALAFNKAVAKLVIRDWRGVEGDDGKKAKVTPEAVEALLDHYALYEAWAERYMARWLGLEQEKNGSAPSQTGTSAGARRTAAGASKSKGGNAKRAPRSTGSRKP